MLSVGVIAAPDQGLAEYAGKDLRNLTKEDRENFRAKVGEIVKPEAGNPAEDAPFEAKIVQPFRSGKAKWIYVEVYVGEDVPDNSGVRVHLFDEAWKQIHSKSYPTGEGVRVEEVRVERNAHLKQDLLVVLVKGALDSKEGFFQKQLHAFTGDRMLLVRLENTQNQVIPNDYTRVMTRMAGSVPKRTKDEWIETLASGPTLEQMAALVWLSGSHLKSSEPRQEGRNQEAEEDSLLYEEVINSEATKTALQKLAKHDFEWIRECAELVLLRIELSAGG